MSKLEKLFFFFGSAEWDIGQEANLDTLVGMLSGNAVMVFYKSLLGTVPALLF